MIWLHQYLSNASLFWDKRIHYLHLFFTSSMDYIIGIMPMICAQSINKTFPDGTEALRDIDLKVKDGELMALVGPSGCGKTTLLRIISGLETHQGENFSSMTKRLPNFHLINGILAWSSKTTPFFHTFQFTGIF